MTLKWLEWAKEMQAISQAGLEYTKDVYDKERFEQLRELSITIMQEYTGEGNEMIRTLFASETGYQTPKVDVRGVIFQDGKLLLVKEKADGAWALPGGWADVGLSPSEVVVKEVKEEAGYEVRAVRLLAVLDKKFHNHPPSAFHVYKMFIQCDITGGSAGVGTETSAVGFFHKDELPPLSEERNTKEQLQRIFEFENNPHLPIWLD
ncbi:ADP-ribose pyrophosphatase [Paenibacillus glucanolyticus]|uniref:ADP-ribose pyrophosphatase n=1 Tax=Paenibacillus glucanolyticus TaxID=59843 RepID=A0A163EM58_9BACL|nr:NUDIX hydrolase [Paenibacillus glucanolyticus]KZS43881.1 ADP-ribose pyrophosphatase [Paenibacillus glucanolyticus]